MYFELQLSGDVFTRIIRNRVKRLPLCIDRELIDPDGTPLVVDRIDVGPNTWLQREQRLDVVNGLPQSHDAATQVVWIFSPTNYYPVTVPYLQVKQEISINLVKRSDLEANGPDPSPAHRTLTVYPVFDIALSAANQTQGGGPLTLSYKPAYVDLGILTSVLSSAQRAEVESFLAGIQVSSTELDLSPLAAQLGRPVSAINAGIACDPGATFVAMRVDFEVQETGASLDRSFFEAGPVNRLGGSDWAMLVDAAMVKTSAAAKVREGLVNSPKVHLTGGPTARWNPGIPAIDVEADIELVDACPFFVEDIDMDAHVTIRSSLSVPTTNVLRTHHNLVGSPSNLIEEVACALTADLLWPFFGAILLERKDIDFGKYLGVMLIPPCIRFIGIMVAIETKGLSQNISNDLGSNCSKQDDSNYECNDPVNLTMQLSPPLNSRLNLEAVTGVAEGPVLSGIVANLPDVRLGELERVEVEPFKWQVLGRCTGNGEGNFRIANKAVIDVYLSPPASICDARIVFDPLHEFSMSRDDVAGTITITPNFTSRYLANPYPCRVRLITTRGVRQLTLQPAQPLDGAQERELEVARVAALASCFVWLEPHTPIEEIHWIPDPPVESSHVIHVWQVVLSALQAGAAVKAQAAGKTVLTAFASPRGVVDMTMLFEGENAPRQLALELEGGNELSDRKREISMQQIVYARTASLPVTGAVREMRFEGSGSTRRLAILDEELEMTWQVAAATAPALISSFARRSAEGEAEIAVHTGRRIASAEKGSLGRALDAVGAGQQLELVAAPRVGAARNTLALRRGSTTRVYDVSGHEPAELQAIEGRPWFDGTAVGGKLLARHDPEDGAVHLYEAVARAVK